MPRKLRPAAGKRNPWIRWIHTHKNNLLAAGSVILAFLILLLLVLLISGRENREAMAPADVEPMDMMGLLVSESEGVPLEAAGALCLLDASPMRLAPDIAAIPGPDAQTCLESVLSGQRLDQAMQYGNRLDWIARIARDKTFPLGEDVNYSYSDGWGMGRSDNRHHEGIDIFAEYGTPILSVCDGVVEKKGWLNLGGWRIGIRGDEDNIYYYYAHMSEYADVEVGDTVKAGQVIGYVGDTGYGPEGTTGQFVAHLHFGMYQGKDDTEKAFSPFPFLTLWDPRRQPDLEVVGKPDP